MSWAATRRSGLLRRRFSAPRSSCIGCSPHHRLPVPGYRHARRGDRASSGGVVLYAPYAIAWLPAIWFASPALRLGPVASGALALNLPFGFWRGGLRKLPPRWFLPVHTPVPLVIALRWPTGLPFRLVTLLLFVAAFFAGQFLGSRLRHLAAHPPGGGAAG